MHLHACRLMYWSDTGTNKRIERASMDGSDRRVLHNTGLTSPNAITIDYQTQRIYWLDAPSHIEYSNSDGTGRFTLRYHFSGFSSNYKFITLDGDLVFWTNNFHKTIHVTHKVSSTAVNSVYTNPRDIIYGIEAVSPYRQNRDGQYCTSCRNMNINSYLIGFNNNYTFLYYVILLLCYKN